MSKAIDELKDKFYKRPLDYGAFWPLIFPAILDLAARLDEAVKRIGELENTTVCPMLKDFSEQWKHAKPLPSGQPKFGPVLNNAKPKPDKEEVVSDEDMIEETFTKLSKINDHKLSYFDSYDILQDLINKVRKQEARHEKS